MLSKNSAGDEVKILQRGLNKFGAMLLVDGRFGGGTEIAVTDARASLRIPGPPVADDSLQAAVAAFPDPFPLLTAAGVTFIARLEVSDAAGYRRKYQKPCWPGKKSGITIGIGYDCAFVSPSDLRADWGACLPPDAIDRLASVVKQVGSDALLEQVDGVVVPLDAAMKVFTGTSLPKYVDSTRRIFPQLDQVTPARRTALVSLVYNRGSGLVDKNPTLQERREMRNIRDLLAAGQVDAVGDEFVSMTRLWDPATERGLIDRRRDEAMLWHSGFPALHLE